MLLCKTQQSCKTLQRPLFTNAVFGYKRQPCSNCLVVLYIVYAFRYDTLNQNLFFILCLQLRAQGENNLDRFVCATSWQSLLYLNPTVHRDLQQVNKTPATSSRLIDPYIKISLNICPYWFRFFWQCHSQMLLFSQKLTLCKPYKEDTVIFKKLVTFTTSG